MHRDAKPANLCIEGPQPLVATPKPCSLGRSRVVIGIFDSYRQGLNWNTDVFGDVAWKDRLSAPRCKFDIASPVTGSIPILLGIMVLRTSVGG